MVNFLGDMTVNSVGSGAVMHPYHSQRGEFFDGGVAAMARGVIGTGSGFCVEWRTAGGVQFLFVGSFLLVLAKISF